MVVENLAVFFTAIVGFHFVPPNLQDQAIVLGELPQEVRSQIDVLSLTQLESLGEALLDFSSLLDLNNWLAQN
ncbi:DUF4351 domain-containing protein [Nostoc sp. FACHB-190]|uniref:DUF4351 domain-containing protein n=1 Tax=Nostoc sp. FACHB-190 TaxID=2692838 RepID=UPI0018EF7965